MTRRSLSGVLSLALLGLTAAGCQGDPSPLPPVHLNPNMDQQARYDMQEPSALFADRRAMRPPVPGTVRRGADATERDLILDSRPGLRSGRDASGYLLESPLPLDAATLQRGRERYDIFCSPCHDQGGSGDGIVVRLGMVRPPSYHEARVLAMPLGQIYEVIAQGVRTMPSYAAQIPVADRWAIAAYVRALQLSRAAGREQVPPQALEGTK